MTGDLLLVACSRLHAAANKAEISEDSLIRNDKQFKKYPQKEQQRWTALDVKGRVRDESL